MIFLFITNAFSFPTCSMTIDAPKGISYYEFDINAGKTHCFYADRFFYVFINNFDNAVVSAFYLRNRNSETALKTIFFDSLNTSATNPLIDFGDVSGLVGIYAKEQTRFRLHTIVLDKQCDGDITVSNSGTDTFYFSPTGNSQCIFPVPICEELTAQFDPQFISENDQLDVFMPDNDKLIVKKFLQRDFSVPFYIIVNATESNESTIRFTYSGTTCTRGTKRLSTQVPVVRESYKDQLGTSAIIGITFGAILLVLVAAILIVCLVIRRKEKIKIIKKEIRNRFNLMANSSFYHTYNSRRANKKNENAVSNNTIENTKADGEQTLKSLSVRDESSSYSTESDFISVEAEIDETPSFFYRDLI
ncbi:hypothetical protein TRFO_32853 [Tritrichomonas foetus]|uniref:Uncharacterized protein n=1 Tax=Tritrichomonas foetus TaxID=1144522 RepID=A0A1J4JPV4_9EUKA|nr:hypothetical protein TRFO_32853 [Tritrichomonas foetus]|eukprot:OHT00448.1 hypothetical protein TRFO_32853 [Tritrichomonas foetus]